MKILSIFIIFLFLLNLIILTSCSKEPEKVEGVEVYEYNSPELAKGPQYKQSKFKIYTLYKPQIQRRDFNGVFDIGPNSARIVRSFWKERFNELTRPGYYDEFFLEFYDYMNYLATAYPVDTRQKEKILRSLEKSFQTFCAVLGIENEFKKFQEKQWRIYNE